jgi:hypothetical protein
VLGGQILEPQGSKSSSTSSSTLSTRAWPRHSSRPYARGDTVIAFFDGTATARDGKPYDSGAIVEATAFFDTIVFFRGPGASGADAGT